MSLAVLFASLWVIAATITAMLPMRWQYPPGLTLLVLAPVLILYLGYEHGVFVALLATAGFVSMFRNPLIYLTRRLLGRSYARPDEQGRR